MIRGDNARAVKARVVAEPANGPTTPDADRILADIGMVVTSDFLCNADSVSEAYFEGTWTCYNLYWRNEDVDERLGAKMTTAFHAVRDAAEGFGVSYRTAARIVAVARVGEACLLRGWI
jgi:glutamate dehydrogenase/leucine dehydrogenase